MLKIIITSTTTDHISYSLICGFSHFQCYMEKDKEPNNSLYHMMKSCVEEEKDCYLSYMMIKDGCFIESYGRGRIVVPIKDHKDEIINYLNELIKLRIKYFNDLNTHPLVTYEPEVFPIVKFYASQYDDKTKAFRFDYYETYTSKKTSAIIYTITLKEFIKLCYKLYTSSIEDISNLDEYNVFHGQLQKYEDGFRIFGVSIPIKYMRKFIESAEKYNLSKEEKYYCLGISDEWQDF